MDLLIAIEQIVEKAKDSKLSPEFYRKASKYIKYVSEKQAQIPQRFTSEQLAVEGGSGGGGGGSGDGRTLGKITSPLVVGGLLQATP